MARNIGIHFNSTFLKLPANKYKSMFRVIPEKARI